MDDFLALTKIAQQWVEIFLPLAIKSSILLSLLLLGTGLMRRASASARHLLWALGVLGLLLLPVMEACLPARLVMPVPDLRPSMPAMNQDQEMPTEPERALAGLPLTQPAEAEPAAGAAKSSSHPVSSPTSARLPVEVWALSVWLLGVFLLTAALLGGWLRLVRFGREALPLTGDGWPELLRSLCGELHLAKPPILLCTARALTPMTWGLWNFSVLLSRDCHHWTIEERREILLHELAHIKRRDCLTQAAAQFICVLHWFNPLVWMAARHMRNEREHACDDMVLTAGIHPSSYATHLLEIACRRGPSAGRLSCGLAIARRSRIFDRLDAVLDPRRRRQVPRRRMTLAAAALTLAVLLPLALSGVSPVALASFGSSRVATCTLQDGKTTLMAEFDGRVRFREDDQAILSLGPRGFFALEERQGLRRVRLEALPGKGGAPEITYRQQGRRGPFDSAARQWLAERLPRVLGEMAINVDSRIRRAYAAGGTPGVLAVIACFESDWARRAHLQSYFDLDEPSSEELARVATWMKTGLCSDFEKAELLSAITSTLFTEQLLRITYLDAWVTVRSDHERCRVLRRAFACNRLEPEHMLLLLDAAGHVRSDYELSRLLEAVAPRVLTGDAALQQAYFDTMDEMESDYERARLLSAIRFALSHAGSLRGAYLEAVERTKSDHERFRTLKAAFDSDQLTREQAQALLKVAGQARSSYELSRLLEEIAPRMTAAPGLHVDYVATIDRIQSEVERPRLLTRFLRDRARTHE